MAFKYGGSVGNTIGGAFSLPGSIPIDVRYVVESKEDLYNPSIWEIHGRKTTYLSYNGLLVAVADSSNSTTELYMCVNHKNVANHDSWLKVGSEITWEDDIVDLNDLSNENPSNEEPNNEEPSNDEPINNDSPEEP